MDIIYLQKRLQCAKNLLADDGLIFISIDDNEVADLKLICNEIFGEPNFRGQIVRSTGTPTGQGNSILVNEIDYILVYSRTDKAIFNGMPFSEEDAKKYTIVKMNLAFGVVWVGAARTAGRADPQIPDGRG